MEKYSNSTIAQVLTLWEKKSKNANCCSISSHL